jgi:hypothetical protein
MIEKQFRVETYKVRAFCECGGEFIATGLVQTCNPPNYQHQCQKCRRTSYSEKRFPSIEYREIDIHARVMDWEAKP